MQELTYMTWRVYMALMFGASCLQVAAGTKYAQGELVHPCNTKLCDSDNIDAPVSSKHNNLADAVL